MTGFYRTAIGGLSKMSSASSLSVESATRVTCVQRCVDFSGTDAKWAACEPGEYLNGILRGGTKYDQKEGASQLAGISCCKVEGLPAEWGKCSEFPIDDAGWSRCTELDENGQLPDDPLVMTGIHRNTGAETSRLDSIKCCALPDVGLQSGGPISKHETDWSEHSEACEVVQESYKAYKYESYDFYGSYEEGYYYR